ncbi:hypothetical protein AAVH_23519, partial [Aphelenchoides avenae]
MATKPRVVSAPENLGWAVLVWFYPGFNGELFNLTLDTRLDALVVFKKGFSSTNRECGDKAN